VYVTVTERCVGWCHLSTTNIQGMKNSSRHSPLNNELICRIVPTLHNEYNNAVIFL